MITHLKARILASAVTLLVVLHPSMSHAAPAGAATAPAELRLDHISIRSTGKGSPVILIPGLSSPRAVWDGVVPDLAKTHRVITVQVNGFGSDAPGRNLEPGILAGIVADLDGYIVREKLGTPAIIGHSMGGLIALMFAKAHPAHVSKLMIVDSLPFYGMLFGPAATVATIEPQAKAMRDQFASDYGKPEQLAAGAEKVANQMALKPDSRVKVKAWAAAADPRVSGAAMYEDLTTDLRPEMAGIKTPITLVYPWNAGGPTKAMAEPLYKAAYADAPAVTYVDIGDAAHFVMLDQPAAFEAAVEGFVGK